MVETFGERLKRLRKSLKLSQGSLADLCGTTQTYISDLEKSRSNNPSLELVGRLARALNVTVKELTGEEDGELPYHIQNFSLWLVTQDVSENELIDIQKLAEIYLRKDKASVPTTALEPEEQDK
jgi:transcriptional regulator with XRE-family HTH domain